MRKVYGYVALACIALAAGEAAAITGNDYQRLTPQERAMYVAGTPQGWTVADTVMRARPSPVFSTAFGPIVRGGSGRPARPGGRPRRGPVGRPNPTGRRPTSG